MDPEPGDKQITVTADDIAAALHEVGIVAGDTAMFHSSLSSMGNVVGGPNTVIEGFLQAVGPEGTVACPTLWWQGKENLADFDINTSPSYPGLITETFRRRPDSIRSNSPTHSVSAIGKRAAELTADHGAYGLRPFVFGDTTFAEASPWQRLYDWNAAYCFIGVDFTVNTMAHLCEARFQEWALQQAPPEKREGLLARVWRLETIIKYYPLISSGSPEVPPLVWARFPFQAMGERLAEEGLVRFGQIGSATLRCIRTQDMVDRTLEILKAEPEQWLTVPEFLEWLHEALEPLS
jgi:aminoglycoside 3-N-acetyltransferase